MRGATLKPVPPADAEVVSLALTACGCPGDVLGRFCDPCFNKEYDAFLVQTGDGLRVVKADDGEHKAYESWLDARPDLPVARRLATAMVAGRRWHVFVDAGRSDLQVLELASGTAAGQALARLHAEFWGADVSPGVRDETVGTRGPRWEALADRFPEFRDGVEHLGALNESVPWTLTQGDLLPMNVLWDGRQATIIDFGQARLRPYFWDAARFLAFGEPGDVYDQPTTARAAFLTAYIDRLRALVPSPPQQEEVIDHVRWGMFAEAAVTAAALLGRGDARADDPALQRARRLLAAASAGPCMP